LPAATLSAITFGASAAGKLIVGGQNLIDRNVIGGATINGVNIQAGINSAVENCQIVNNLIGLTPNGQVALANNVGVNVSGSACAIIGNRIAGNSSANIWLNGGSNNVVQQNDIGVTTQNLGLLNNAVGILVTGNNNVIGAVGNGGWDAANTVRFMVAGGIVVRGDAATGNVVQANFVYENGTSGNGMDIDLQPINGVSGPNPNDPGDTDGGANMGQNFPVPTQITYVGDGYGPEHLNRAALLNATLDTLPGTYRIDAYFSNAIDPNTQRGHAEIFMTRKTVTVTNRELLFFMALTVPNQSAGGVISLTATDAAGNTSEVGTALAAVGPSIFNNGFE
jgi:hypothetical protein